MMNSDPDQFLNRLVVATLTVFVTVSLLLAAFIVREIWLQQRIALLSVNLQDNLADLTETAEEMQSDLSEIRTTTDGGQQLESLGEVTKLLTDFDEQLESIEEEIYKVTTILDDESTAATNDHAESAPVADRADRVFTIFAVLTSITGIVIAIFLGMATRVQTRLPRPESHQREAM